MRGGSLKHRIADLFRVQEDELIDASEQTEIVGITGYVGSPKLAKRTRGNQYLFTNGRFIKDAYLNHAISSAYGGLLEDKTYPFFVVFLDVEPSKIDVNIHPTKHEVKFEDGRHVYTLLQSVIKKTLGVHFVMPTPTQLNNALSNGQSQNYNPTLKTTNPDIRFNPFDATKQRTSTEWEKLDELLNTPVNQVQQQQIFENSPTSPTERTTNVTDVFQVEGAFIITHLDGELCLVNQHRAHEQVLYERYEANQHVSSQQLLFPRTVELSKADLTLYLEMKDEINALGFDTSEFGKDAIIINGLPSELSKADGADVIVKILDDFKTNYQDIKLDKRDALKQAAAKNAAIKAGKVLGKEEMIQLLSDLLHCKQYTTNQAGKAIIVKLTNSSLERFFQ